MLKVFYRSIFNRCSLLLSQKVKALVDIVVLISSSYLMVKKLTGFSISTWLMANAIKGPFLNFYLYSSVAVLFAAIFLKVLVLIFENFPPQGAVQVDPDEISECIGVINHEIVAHLYKCDYEAPVNVRTLSEQHTFEKNIRAIVLQLSEHIRRCIKSIKIKKKDLFISLYSYSEETNTLVYELHFDAKRDLVKSKEIELSNRKYSGYECVKCMNSERSTAYMVKKDSYVKGHSKRHKTIEQYMGCKLEANGYVFGFLNIEFHNGTVFGTEEDMQDFMECSVFPYKTFLEYQYLKQKFFRTFKNFEEHWSLG